MGRERKEKGTRVERELINLLWDNGFAAVRVAGSGSASFPCPDVVASNGKVVLAFEVKTRSKLPMYLTYQEVKELVMFSNLFGAKPYIALKIPRREWYFIEIDVLVKTSKGFRVDEEVVSRSCDVNEVLGKSRQLRLF